MLASIASLSDVVGNSGYYRSRDSWHEAILLAASLTSNHKMGCVPIFRYRCIVMDHLILAATDEGLGTCWVCHFDEARLKQILRIPDNVRVIALTPLGFPATGPRPFQRKPLEELVRREHW